MNRNNIAIIYETLVRRYPQLGLPVRRGMKDSPEYREAVRRGKFDITGQTPPFHGDIDFSAVNTIAGRVEILTLTDRKDFVRALRQLAYRCEPAVIPDSVGAMTVRGLINWEKINQHRKKYIEAGGEAWSTEFKRFTSDKKNYLDTLILLSGGAYSNVSPEDIGLTESEWQEKSMTIRKYHELTHFICRTRRPDDVDVIRDEVLADLIGLKAAFGKYDPELAKRFLGIEGTDFREAGRLSYYVNQAELSEAVRAAEKWISFYSEQILVMEEDMFATLQRLF